MASSLQQYRQELENRNLPSDLIDRMVRSRQKSTRDVALQSGLGERIFDRILGGTSAAGYTVAGGLSDLAGGLGGFLGGPFTEDAATLKEFADEAYRRAKPLALEGYKKGSVTASKNAVPMIDLPFYGETEMLANLQDKINSPEYLGEFGGLDPSNYNIKDKPPAPKLSEQEMANVFSDVEGKSDLYRQLAEIEARAKDKKIPDVDFIDPSLAEANKEQTRISQAKAEEKALSAQEESFDQPDPDPDSDPVTDSFMEVMKQFIADAGKQDVAVKGETKKQKLDRYKKEFEDVTGIDASGKVDKSRFLTVLGLKLMQNRAGKNVDLGKIFREVGEAGEAAMPELSKAIDRADAAKLAAGKYALEQVRSDESSAAAFAKERRLADDAFKLKIMQLDYEAMKDKTKGKELKNVGPNEIIQGVKIHYGTSAGDTKLAKPSADATAIANAWNKYSAGQNNINEMLKIAEELGEVKAPAFQTFGDRVKKQLANLGLRDPEIDFGEEGTSAEDRFNATRLSVINEMKRLIIQESQVSDYDRKMLDASFGEINLTTTPQQTIFALNEMLKYFNGKKQNLVLPLQHMYDRDFYVNDTEYGRTMEYLQKSLESPFINPSARNQNGTPTTQSVATVDLTGASE